MMPEEEHEKVLGIKIGFVRRKDSSFLNANFYIAKENSVKDNFFSNEEIQKGIEKALIGVEGDYKKLKGYFIGEMAIHFFPETKAILWTSYYPFDKSFVNMKNFLEKKGIATMLEDKVMVEAEKRFGEIKKVMHVNALVKRERQVNKRHGKKMISRGRGTYSFKEARKAIKKVLQGKNNVKPKSRIQGRKHPK